MNTQTEYTLISHHLCPYVQRSVIALEEKRIPYERVNIDLANKPDWFNDISPSGKVPLLIINDEHILFEANVITEYLNEVTPGDLHSSEPLTKATHRAWIEFGTGILNDISGLYSAQDSNTFDAKLSMIEDKLMKLEQTITHQKKGKPPHGPYFSGSRFQLIDGVYSTIFRYFDVFQGVTEINFLQHTPHLKAWNHALQIRHSVIKAVPPDYPERLTEFVRRKNGHLATLILEKQGLASFN